MLSILSFFLLCGGFNMPVVAQQRRLDQVQSQSLYASAPLDSIAVADKQPHEGSIALDEESRANTKLDYTIETEHFFPCPADQFWFQARAAAMPASAFDSDRSTPRVILTMQPHGMKGTHNYKGIVSAKSDDIGKTWEGPTMQPALNLREMKGRESGRFYEVPVDATPQYHPKSGKLLLIGATFNVDRKTKRDVPGGQSNIFYAVYDPQTARWAPWKTVDFPNSFHWPYKRSGCVQWLEESNGEVLLPFYFGEHNNSIHYSAIARCKFDGETLSYVEHGSEHKLDTGRGMSEPSLAKFKDEYYLTMRNDEAPYLSTSPDGLHFSEAKLWRFDDGEELASYNTQQHFMTHSQALFLVYTRRAADNGDVMRHRAPLYMAQIDPKMHRLLRATERIVVPKEGSAAMGNFGVSAITPQESWVVVAKRTKTAGEKNVIISRIRWNTPNSLVSEQAKPQ
ncbi:hypothetical protein HG15A2_21070 [Adhaeretor mobilis]|uniref:Exo-alpha-sialidase n=2 Tax=Adhaeretor mobilis TaxID=1930276 RepID=A0A517MVC1_9BACT|nr:hypothetical protein HG15A2_21070 [Adhaeretor mobilis]